MDWHLTKSMETRPTAQMDEIAARQSNRIHPTRRKNGYIYVGSSKGLYIFQGEKLQSYLPFQSMAQKDCQVRKSGTSTKLIRTPAGLRPTTDWPN